MRRCPMLLALAWVVFFEVGVFCRYDCESRMDKAKRATRPDRLPELGPIDRDPTYLGEPRPD